MGFFRQFGQSENRSGGKTIIATGCCFAGEFTQLNGDLLIDGHFDGVVVSNHDVSIGVSGFCKGLIKAEHVVICGKVEAQIACQRLEILATGELHGEVICCEFVLEEGAEFVGQRYELMASGVVMALPEEIEHLRHHQLLEFAGLTLAFEAVDQSER